MPTYDYECLDCGNRFEHFQNMSDSPLADCPECNGRLERLIGGGAGIIMKGAGYGPANLPQCSGPACGGMEGNGECCGGAGGCDVPPCHM